MTTTGTMEELKQSVLFGLDYVWIRLEESLEGLTDEQIRWRPYDVNNSIGAILLHMCRSSDGLGSRRFLKQPPLWDKEGGNWRSRLGVPDPPPGEGGWDFDVMSPGENAITLEQLKEYFLATQETLRKAVRAAEPEFLLTPVVDSNPHHVGWTNASWLLHNPLHMSHHQAQIDYVSGLIKADMAK